MLAVALIFIFGFMLSPAYALNCTKFKGDERNLCRTINPLPLAESYKVQLMKPDLYGSPNTNEPIHLNLQFDEQEKLTTAQIYQDNIEKIAKLGLFIILNYALFSFLTKPSKIIKWLHADS